MLRFAALVTATLSVTLACGSSIQPDEDDVSSLNDDSDGDSATADGSDGTGTGESEIPISGGSQGDGGSTGSGSDSSEDGNSAVGGSATLGCDINLLFVEKCGSCHGGLLTLADLDLVSPGVDSRLLNVPSVSCAD